MNELNSPKRIEIRRHHNQLKVTSDGVLILGLWSMFRVFLLTDSNDSASLGINNSTGSIIAFIIVNVILLLIDFRFRLVIWRGARREAYGRNTNNRYLVFTVILIIVSGISTAMLIYSLINMREDMVHNFASLLVEVTSFAIMCELLHSGFSLRKIRSVTEDGEEEVS